MPNAFVTAASFGTDANGMAVKAKPPPRFTLLTPSSFRSTEGLFFCSGRLRDSVPTAGANQEQEPQRVVGELGTDRGAASSLRSLSVVHALLLCPQVAEAHSEKISLSATGFFRYGTQAPPTGGVSRCDGVCPQGSGSVRGLGEDGGPTLRLLLLRRLLLRGGAGRPLRRLQGQGRHGRERSGLA